MPTNHVIVGGGPASIAAAQAIRSLDASARLTIVSADPSGYYSRPGLAYFLAREVPERGLFPFTPSDFAELGIDWIAAHADTIEPAEHLVRLADGRALPYDRLLLATGSRALPAGVPGAELDGVVKLDDFADARDLVRRAGKAKTAVVVGGGITALEIVEGLRTHGVAVHYFVRKQRYWGNVLSERESELVAQGLKSSGVNVHYSTQLARIVGQAGRVSAVETVGGAVIPCDMVAVAIGVMPAKDLAQRSGLACERGILIDDSLRSSNPDIFAAGDVAEVIDAASGKRTVEVLWNSGVAKGRIAGRNMASGSAETYASGCPLNVTRLAGSKITIMGTVGGGEDADLKGISRGDSETWRRAGSAVTAEEHAPNANVRLLLGSDRIVGAVVMGDQELSFPLQRIIGDDIDVRPIIGALQAPGAPITELIREFWRETKAAEHA